MSTFPQPPLNDASSQLSRPWHLWYDRLSKFLANTAGLIPWTSISKAGSNLTEITTRNHADLQNINTATYTHLTATDHTDLTDSGNSALHFHSSDRARANHTGTQLATTISDFTEAAQDVAGGMATDSASIDFVYDDAANTLTANLKTGGVMLRHEVTGIMTGGVMSVAVGGTTFSITDGTGQVINNYTSPLSPTITSVSWSGKTNITDTLLSDPANYITIDSTGAVGQQATAPTDDELRDKILIGVIAHSNNLIIASAALMVASYNNGNLAQDILSALGTITTGCTYSGNAALTMSRSSGSIFRRGAQYATDTKTPNAVDLSAQNPVQFASYCRNGSDTVFSNSAVGTTLTANRYDDGTATAAGIPNGVLLNNRWQALRLFLSPNGFTLLQYGQTTYTSLNDAVEGVGGETFFQAPITRLTAFRGYLFVRGGASNLSDIGDAFFQSAGKLGDVGTVGGASVFEHNSLSGLQGGTASEYYHLTSAQHTDLTDAGDSALHFHASDRARANHTGTQALATISDVTITAANLNTLDDGVNTTLHFHDSDRARANHTGTQTMSTISDLPTLASGTYTPTLTNTTNVDASTAYSAQWMRVGDVVTVSARVDVDVTVAGNTTVLGISLPVASNFANANELAGNAAGTQVASLSGGIYADTTNDRASLQYVPPGSENRQMWCVFTYRVL